MTLEEKVNITGGFQSPDNACNGFTGTVPRLDWPGMCLQDAGNGVRGVDLANSYPSGIHVGASWDKNLTYRRGLEMGNEFRIKGGESRESLPCPSAVVRSRFAGEHIADGLWTVNIALGPVAGPLGRTAVGGRNWEGFSVDPYLSGVLTAETIRGIQDAGVIANLKVSERWGTRITTVSGPELADLFSLPEPSILSQTSRKRGGGHTTVQKLRHPISTIRLCMSYTSGPSSMVSRLARQV